MAQNAVLFDDLFEVVKLNPDGKKFDRGWSVVDSPEYAENGKKRTPLPPSRPSHLCR